VQAEVAKGAKDGGDMAMRKRAKDLKGLLAGDQILALQDATQEIDLSGGPGGEIGEGALVDFGADADRFAEKDGRGRVTVGDGFYVHGSMIYVNNCKYKINTYYYMGTRYTPQKSQTSEFSRPYTENGVKKSGNFGLASHWP
jgi:hypothetical protein